MDFSTLQNNIYTWINGEIALMPGSHVVIWQYSNAPRPERPYISLLIPTITPVGHTSYGKVDENGIITILSQNLMTLSITYHGKESAQNMSGQQALSQILLSTKKEYVQQLFINSKIGFMTRLAQSTMQNLVGTSFEEQSILDLSFMLLTDITDDVGLIEHVEISGQFLDAEGNTRYEEVINI